MTHVGRPRWGDVPRPPLGVLLLTSPLWLCLALISWLALAFTRWGHETDPVDQLVRDLGWLLVSAGFGVAAVWVVVRLFHASPWWALSGVVPAALTASAYFTSAY